MESQTIAEANTGGLSRRSEFVIWVPAFGGMSGV
ncbi:MAG: hypothetical protein FD125_916 [bacterium]|nr:MAG: hypothetical protein FD125_916 [bacterium]